ncbi:hypothetical protein [Nitratidesulfovibrio sp. SRB-5]|uniref:hypothetical protein n=1 Tax=Nitratidesulfovibrio sp. SRB-5 TaxID=2872636 RepID=UPI0010276DBE|nr:hypothetical protein [Nitratidesulfovibrio sp. SRB-5]MBZ2170428.1 hypothetical protein [Nitratidesulfovibrio sp. SRB-5]RXF78200.1 hypothetical protein EKK70_02530 [Desulfovibrio sp. DS-1]
MAERYTYNTAGQRITARVNPLPGMSRDALRMLETERVFAYDNTGRLVRAGQTRYMYAPDGVANTHFCSLARKTSPPPGRILFSYPPDVAGAV